MTAVVPSIHVYNKKSRVINADGMASKVAVIGAFKTEDTTVKLFKSIDEAQTAWGSDDTFNGCAVIEDLFVGASSLLCVNISTKSEDVWTKTMNTTNLAAALAKIKGEDFDILFIAETLTDTFLPVITAFLDSTYEMKYPAGYVGCLNGGSTSADVTSAALAGDHCYGLITQSFYVDGVSKSLLKSAAYYCGLLAGMNVGSTMTMKIVPGVTAVSPELVFDTGGAGKTLLEAGITTFKCQDRGEQTYIIVNSEQQNGFDLYVNRVRDYVVKQMSLHKFLGERNRDLTLDEIKHEIMRVKDLCVSGLDLLRDIEFEVIKKSASQVDIHITRLLFDGIITRIDVYVTVEVE